MGTDVPESRFPYGDELRKRREDAGLTQELLSQQAIMSRTHIAHIEGGRRKPSLDDARRLDQVLGTGGVFERFLPTLDSRKVAVHFAAAAEFEQQATMIREYASSLVPGLLQTEEYARAVFRFTFPPKSDDERDSALVTRLGRARILDNPVTPVLWTMLDEAVLRRPVGGPGVMAEQLRHLQQLGDRERIRLHVLPFSVGAHALMESSLTLTWLEDSPPIAYVEGVKTGAILDDPAVVHHCQAIYDLALGDALSHRESLALIKAVAEEYEKHEQQ
ncbi:helix-turn-helix transcriptional regulator [Streptomyces sp. ISL-100]|uniref:helix-turn-helix domain-containing protein n=1 Tax=Streptomyces sp. ISL-100 TaxID=2819173 RepID=UPI001BE7611B|nr:helix-turn-helix transcriptional regulator [Streptomyces sp. ISL-100]MBT2397700.1 helix-turn-helix transcriptional regulator [Streptomyces sp. ISL-100]